MYSSFSFFFPPLYISESEGKYLLQSRKSACACGAAFRFLFVFRVLSYSARYWLWLPLIFIVTRLAVMSNVWRVIKTFGTDKRMQETYVTDPRVPLSRGYSRDKIITVNNNDFFYVWFNIDRCSLRRLYLSLNII